MNKCYKCPYFDRRLCTCDYLLITGERRGCSIADCEIYLFGKAKCEKKLKTDDNAERFAELYREGLMDTEIAERLGVTKLVVFRWRKQNNLPCNRYRNKTKNDYDKVSELYRAGLGDKEIAERVGICERSVQRWRYANDLPFNYKKKVVVE